MPITNIILELAYHESNPDKRIKLYRLALGIHPDSSLDSVMAYFPIPIEWLQELHDRHERQNKDQRTLP